MGITEMILTICGVIAAVGGAAAYIAKAIGAAMKPTNELKMVNDYSRTAKIIGQDDADFYFNLAYDFINDEDAKPDKIAKYFMY